MTQYVTGTPAQQLEKAILARVGVTEEDLKKMTPEEREKVMAQVREMVKRELAAEQQSQREKKAVI